MATKTRLDRLLVERDLVESRTRAQALIMAGKVEVEGRRVDKPGTSVPNDARIEVRGPDHPYVSRGGLKLHGALEAFGGGSSAQEGPARPHPHLQVSGRIAMDVGASTGGFTDCLLQHGVQRVHAVDVGYGQLAWKLASDARVRIHDRQNIRKLDPTTIGEPVDLVVVDCSFIALAKVIPHLSRFLTPRADVVALIKPQFELDPRRVGKGGIVRSEQDRADAVGAARAAAEAAGFIAVDVCPSPISGREGNVEYLLWMQWEATGGTAPTSP